MMKAILLLSCAIAATAMAQETTLSLEKNREAVRRLHRAIDERYSHRDRVVKDWSAHLLKATPELESAPTEADFARRLAELLGAATDPHINVLAGGKPFPTFLFKGPRNADPKRLPRILASFKQESNQVLTGRTREGFGYILIAQWPAPDSPQLKPVHAALDAFNAEKLPAVILDVRVNSGGNDLAALAVANRFARTDAEFCRVRTRDPMKPDGWTPWRPRVLAPAPEPRRFTGRVAVLCGPACMSSNETFLLMMRAAGAKLVGTRTRGSSGNPKPHDLGNGVTVMLPSWQEVDAKGQPIEGRGIEPDVRAEFGTSGDEVLAAAIRELRSP